MGFAGQVFAARVAVGLAMPSPKAFSQAGTLIGGFASKMYNSLNKDNVKAGQQQVKNAQAQLNKSKNSLAKHTANQEAFLSKSSRQAISRVQSAYKALGKTAAASSGAMKGMKAAVPKPIRRKLFPGLAKDLGDGKSYVAMMKGFQKMTKEQRRETLLSIQAGKLKLENQVSTLKKREELGVKETQLIKDEIAMWNLIEKEYKHYDDVRKNADSEYSSKKKKYTEKVTKDTKTLQQAQEELAQTEKEQIAIQNHLTTAANDFAVTMKTNFIDSVRESISALTAFYYKLNQNTQELIEFERELLNANSVFRVTNDELFAVGDTVVQFGQKFGLEMQNGAEGLYQLASAGLSASESMQVLTETLKLSMAVQGDHNTISKLVTQTLFGFDMEMSRAAEVTDKFAYAIQKSLIEYQDLASAVKFALPFFTTTGQSIDQLLGALQILTNRALEAGIAGRGLRQGLAELAESIGDNTARFRQYGIEVTDSSGKMLKLTEIAANFSDVLQAGVINDTELLTTLIEDLNVRGATAFVHLVQASDEFTAAVEATKNAGGELDEMVRIQNESIMAQIQILKNNIGMMFMYRDSTYEGTRFLNAFHEAIVTTVESLRNIIVVEREGIVELSAFGKAIQTLAIKGIKEFRKVMDDALPLLEKFVEFGKLGISVFKIYLIPLKLIIKAVEIMGPTFTKLLIVFHLLNKIIPISTILKYAYFTATMKAAKATTAEMYAQIKTNTTQKGLAASTLTLIAYQGLKTKLLGLGTLGYWNMNAAETYSAGLKAAGIVLSEKEQLNMTRTIYLQTLAAHGTVLEAEAIAFKESTQVVELQLQQKGFFWRIKEIHSRWLNTVAVAAGVAVEEVSITLQLRHIAGMIYAQALRAVELIQKAAKYIMDMAQSILDGITLAVNGFLITSINASTAARWAGIPSKYAEASATAESTSLLIANYIIMKLSATWEYMLAAAKWVGIAATAVYNNIRVISLMLRGQKVRLLALETTTQNALFITRVRNFIVQKATDLWTWTMTIPSLIDEWAARRILGFEMKLGTLQRIGDNMVRFITNVLTKWTIRQTIQETVAGIIRLVTYIAFAAVQLVYNILTGIAGVLTWGLAGAVIAATWPFILIGLAIVITVGALYTLVRVLDENFGIMFKLGQFLDHLKLAFIDLGHWIISPFVWLGQAVFNLMEGPMFKFILFLSHFFKMISYYFKQIKTWFIDNMLDPIKAALGTLYNDYLKPYLIDPIVGFFTRIVEIIKNPLKALKELGAWISESAGKMWDGLKNAAKRAIDPIVNLIQSLIDKLKGLLELHKKGRDAVAGGAKKAGGAIVGGGKKIIGGIGSALGLAEGGYVQAMARGGIASRGPYIVGEKGPEIFMPRTAGRIIPTKDLSTKRVRDMLRKSFEEGRPGDRRDKVLTIEQMNVGSLQADNTQMNKARLGIDAFAPPAPLAAARKAIRGKFW